MNNHGQKKKAIEQNLFKRLRGGPIGENCSWTPDIARVKSETMSENKKTRRTGGLGRDLTLNPNKFRKNDRGGEQKGRSAVYGKTRGLR